MQPHRRCILDIEYCNEKIGNIVHDKLECEKSFWFLFKVKGLKSHGLPWIPLVISHHWDPTYLSLLRFCFWFGKKKESRKHRVLYTTIKSSTPQSNHLHDCDYASLYLSQVFCIYISGCHFLWLRCSLGGSYYVSLRHATCTCLLICMLPFFGQTMLPFFGQTLFFSTSQCIAENVIIIILPTRTNNRFFLPSNY